MKLKDFVKEHKRLIKILNKGTKAQQRKEAKDQAAELAKRLKKN
jgi:hemerythrin